MQQSARSLESAGSPDNGNNGSEITSKRLAHGRQSHPPGFPAGNSPLG